MKSALISLFLKREHLILLTRMILMTNPNCEDDQRLHKIEQKYQRKEMQILRHLKFNQNDLDTFQTMAINIANLTFSYFKLHFPMNASLIIKEHIKFIQQIKQINFGGITVEQLLNYQRHRLSQEKTKLLKGVKLPEEQIMPKNINLKIDLAYVQYLQDKYFHPRNPDHRQPYQILNITNQQYKRMRITNREIFQSITSLDDIPSLQMINTNHIQPILNYDSFNVQFEAKFAKMMQRNQYVASTIKKYQQNHFKKQEFCLTTRSVCQENQTKSMLIRLDPQKLSILRQSVDAMTNEVVKYKVDPKSVPLRQSKFLNSPSVNSSKNFQDSNQDISEKQSECKRLVKPIEKLILKPIDYQSVCFGEMQTTKQQSSLCPQIREYPKILTQKEIELQLENEINNTNFPCMNQPDQERMRKIKQLREIQQFVQAKRFHTSSEREEYNAVYEVIYKKNSTTYQTMRQSIPLLNKKNVQNQLILLTNKYSRSEQLLTSLIASGAIKGKQSEIFEQFLKPIKISSSAKVLTPKARQMILRTKINLEQKVYNMK